MSEEQAVIDPGWGPQAIEIKDGKITGLHVSKCLSVFDDDGRFSPRFDQNQKKFFPADMIIESIGQGMDISYTESIKEHLEMGSRGKVKTDAHFQTSMPWFFVGGDIVVGPDVITGIANGHKAAIGIDAYLQSGKSSAGGTQR